ncbi:DUF4159 domain-containing protein [Rhodocaloribacter litoris]|nr:DUF4159 domain-containing protein [Rhodocaloribacter litoris]QXD17036.1 DUF4159 domain-containing protein [Rhodocaloribacter litoris]GIV60045.1 MAG: hypothetical protein KatS3mg043_1134 [Rhodothermaceae bacterium]
MTMRTGWLLLVLGWTTGLLAPAAAQQGSAIEIAALKYGGGGDWYQAQTPLPTFIAFVREQTMLEVAPRPAVVEPSSDKLFNYPFLVLSGHGNVSFTDDEARRLRRYLTGGGFLYIDDDYGLDPFIRREMKKVFPELEFVELPFSHPIYHTHFEFSHGLPKIHEHDGKPPQGFGLIYEGRLVAFYTYETNLSDGWEPPEVHNDPPEKRLDALRMGTNILVYAMMH